MESAGIHSAPARPNTGCEGYRPSGTDAEQARVRYREARDAFEGVRGHDGSPCEVIRGARLGGAVIEARLIARFEGMRVEGRGLVDVVDRSGVQPAPMWSMTAGTTGRP